MQNFASSLFNDPRKKCIAFKILSRLPGASSFNYSRQGFFYLQVLHVLHAGLSWLSTFVAPGWTGRFPSLAQVGQMLGPCFAWNPPDRPSAAQIYEAQPFVLPGMVQRVRNHGNCRNSLPVFLFSTFCREDQCSGKQKAWTLFGPTEEVRQFSSNCVLKA